MDDTLLEYFQNELRHLRETAHEFGRKHPQVARELSLEEFRCRDPYVERLLEGFAFLTARVQRKFDAEFPRFTQHLIETVYPNLLSPIPSVAIVQFQPKLDISEGTTIPRHTILRATTPHGGDCVFRTAHRVDLWPVQFSSARFLGSPRQHDFARPMLEELPSSFHFVLQTFGQLPWRQLVRFTSDDGDQERLDSLTFYLQGDPQVQVSIYRKLLHPMVRVFGRRRGEEGWTELPKAIRGAGFAEDEVLLPRSRKLFSGHRLLQEFFALSQRFLFVELSGLSRLGGDDDEIELLVAGPDKDDALKGVHKSNFAMYCSPIVNLFPRTSLRIHLDERRAEHQIVFDRSSFTDYELHSVTSVAGYEAGHEKKAEFVRFYDQPKRTSSADRSTCFYALRRVRKNLPRGQTDGRTDYLGSECFLSIVDSGSSPYPSSLKQLGVEALCTNRDLPLLLDRPEFRSDVSLDAVEMINCLMTPSDPREAPDEEQALWRLINHLSLNYSALINPDRQGDATAIRRLIGLFCDSEQPEVRLLLDGIRSLRSRPTVRPIPQELSGHTIVPSFARGVEIEVNCGDAEIEQTELFLLTAVLEQVFGRFVSINSFTETVLTTKNYGEVMRWPARIGIRTSI